MNRPIRSMLALVALLGLPPIVFAVPVGEVTATVRGSVAAQGPRGEVRLLERGDQISTGQLLTTSNGFAVLRLGDGTLVTLRPNTTFAVEAFSYGRRAASARLGLRSGGVRVLTGDIGARNPGGFVLATPGGTVRPHGTDFEARLCESDCEDEAKRVKPNPPSQRTEVAARVVFLRGRATAEKPAGRTRTLALGGSLFEKETLRSAQRSVVAVAFQDGQRATLQADTSMVIDRYRPPEAGEQSTEAQLRLLKGGMRLLAGLKEKHLSVAMTVTTATGDVKVASQGVDVACKGSCESDPEKSSWLVPGYPMLAAAHGLLDLLFPPAYARGTADGLLARPWGGGEVILTGRGGSSARVGSGRALWLSGANAVPVELPEIPPSMDLSGLPRPDLPESMDPSMRGQTLFGGIRQDLPEPGLYLRVVSGDVTFFDETGRRLDLGAGDSAFSRRGGGRVDRLEQPPPLLETPEPVYLEQLSVKLRLPGTAGAVELEELVGAQCLTE